MSFPFSICFSYYFSIKILLSKLFYQGFALKPYILELFLKIMEEP